MLPLTVLVQYNQPVCFQNDFVDNTPVAVSGLCSPSLVGERRSAERRFSSSLSVSLFVSLSISVFVSVYLSVSLFVYLSV